MPNILLVTVTRIEAEAVLELLPKSTGVSWTRKFVNSKPYYSLGELGGVDVFMVQSEMGAVGPGATLITVLRAIQDVKPIVVIMVGIAFGVDPNTQKLGDILVSRQIRSYEQQKVKGTKLIPRGDRVTAPTRLLGLFRDGDLDWQGAKVHFGLILSGEKLVMSQSFRNELLRLEPESIGGEMEGAGVYAAASEAKLDWVLVKAICDWADESKNYDSQALAANNAVNFVIHVLRRGGLSNVGHKLDSLHITLELSEENTASVLTKPSFAFNHLNSGGYNTHNPNNPFLIWISSNIVNELEGYSPVIQLRFKSCYWGRAPRLNQLVKYISKKRLNHLPIDIVHLPIEGNARPAAWMEVHNHFCYFYSGWGNRYATEDIIVVDKNKKEFEVLDNLPVPLFGFETIRFLGKPNVEQLYIPPVTEINYDPPSNCIELMQKFGLWVSAGFSWIKVGDRKRAIFALEKAVVDGLSEEVNQQVVSKINLLKMGD